MSTEKVCTFYDYTDKYVVLSLTRTFMFNKNQIVSVFPESERLINQTDPLYTMKCTSIFCRFNYFLQMCQEQLQSKLGYEILGRFP